MAEAFHELHGDYVEHAGQQISLREYLDYFEPLGSALARLPDGSGGPFVHHFTDGAGRTISAVGWVVSAKSKRFGGWKLWGMWTDRPMPPAALPLFWGALSDPARVSEWVSRANEDADRLLDPERWTQALGELKTTRLKDAAFRQYLTAELARAYAVPLPHRHPIEVEVTPAMLALLPWLYLLGPVDPMQARLQPNRFSGPGYQYILADELPTYDVSISSDVEAVVEAASKNIVSGYRAASELRARRERPTRSKPVRPRERSEMRSAPSSSPAPPPPPPPKFDLPFLIDAAWKVLVLLVLLWIGWNVQLLRKGTSAPATTTTTVAEPVDVPADDTPATTSTVAPRYEPDLSSARLRRVADRLIANPPRNVRVNAASLREVTAVELAHASVEVFIRRSGCLTGGDAVDGKFSTAELRAIRNCATLQDEHLMKDRTDPDAARAVDWLEEITR